MTNLPFTGRIKITCEFGKKGEWQAGFHTGIDLIGLDNKTIYSTHNGLIIFINNNPETSAYGKYIKMKDENGYIHLFAHLSSITVKLGQTVNRTTKLGIMGATGNVSGAHLHYEIRNSNDGYGNVINPVAHLGIPNKPDIIINSNDYQIKETPKYKVGNQVACSTRYPQPNSDITEVEHLNPYKKGIIAYIEEGSKNKYLIQFDDKQAWCNDGDIRN